jgi:ribosomal protein S27AE
MEDESYLEWLENGRITCLKCGHDTFDIRPKKIKKDGKIWQRIVCERCGDWFLADVEEDK